MVTPRVDGKLSEGETEILELESRLKKAQEAGRLRGPSGGLAVGSSTTTLSGQKFNLILVGIQDHLSQRCFRSSDQRTFS